MTGPLVRIVVSILVPLIPLGHNFMVGKTGSYVTVLKDVHVTSHKYMYSSAWVLLDNGTDAISKVFRYHPVVGTWGMVDCTDGDDVAEHARHFTQANPRNF